MTRVLALAGCAGFAAPSAMACAVCFGQGDNPDVARAYTWAIAILLGCTFAILALLCYAIWRIEVRREKVLHARFFGPNGSRPIPKKLASWASK